MDSRANAGVYTSIRLHSVGQFWDGVPQVFDPHVGVILYLGQIAGSTAAAALVIVSAIAVPLLAGQSSIEGDWNRKG